MRWLESCSKGAAEAAKLQFASNAEAMSFGKANVLGDRAWLTWRSLILAYFVASVAYSLIVQVKGELEYYPTYLTYWMLATEAIYALSMLVVSVIYSRARSTSFVDFSVHTRRFVYWTWFVLNIVGPGCLIVSAIYWGLLYKGGVPSHNTINVHAVNAVLIMLDVLVSAAPFRLIHVWCVGVFGAAYVLWLTIYFLVAHKIVYDVIDFHKAAPSTYFLLATFFVAIPVACIVTSLVKKIGRTCTNVPEGKAETSDVEFRAYNGNSWLQDDTADDDVRKGENKYSQDVSYSTWTGVDRV